MELKSKKCQHVPQVSFLSAGVNDFHGVRSISPLQPSDVKARLGSEPTSLPGMGMLLGRSLGEPKAVLPRQR